MRLPPLSRSATRVPDTAKYNDEAIEKQDKSIDMLSKYCILCLGDDIAASSRNDYIEIH
jgi:hypothetical protein